MQKFGNLDKWRLVQKGEPLQFSGDRTVRLEVSTPRDTDWSVRLPDAKKLTYLCTTSGREVLVFHAQKGLELVPSGDVRYHSAEGHEVHIAQPGNPVYTKVANRQARNPELEKVAAIAAQNATARMERMFHEERRRHEAQLEQVRAENGETKSGAGSSDGEAKTDAAGGGGVSPKKEADPGDGAEANAGNNEPAGEAGK